MQKEPIYVAKIVDPRILEGEITRVDYPNYTLVVRDIDGRERKAQLKRGTIGGYQVGDYVVIHLTRDLQDALTIKTRHSADIEGDVVSLDHQNDQLVVREGNGTHRLVITRPGTINTFKVGDYVRLYITSDDPARREAQIIRVR